MQVKLGDHHLNRQTDRARGVPSPLVWVPDPVAEFCLPPRSAHNVLDRYLPDDNIAGQAHATPRLAAVVPLKHAFDTAALPCSGVVVRRPLWIPPGEGFGIAGEVGGQRSGIIGPNETDTGSRCVHITWTSRMRGTNRQRSVPVCP